MLEYLTIGIIINVHGVMGEVKIAPETDDIKRFKKLKSVLVVRPQDGNPTERKVESVKLQNEFVILKLEGIDDRDVANKYRGYEIRIPRGEGVKLPEDTYYIGDLIGCTVVETDGNVLGKVDNVFTAGGSDVYSIIDEQKRNIMIPALGETIMNVDIENCIITVKLLPGLKEIYYGNT